ncbi:glycoside hydrolase family 95 protein [Sphingobacterium multivorum]|uniref:glycoside hydrolase family 95 protein n=1 Tax=Sphingobacterium multivorum TaxID=28454 RepID=UPI000E0E633C|nr:glycoside hydrolase family 95 protein [Sphingobacterium multivorum]QQT46208.1 glycoside hydrolase family 95 protein [Sphingobacterium multivorum]
MMRVFFIALFASVYAVATAQENNALKLWYTKPATQFEEALPLGNGRLGAMVYGGVDKERISLNEATLWSGGPIDAAKVNPDAKRYLQPIREALFNEDYKKADSLAHFMQGPYSEAFMPLGNLFFDFASKGNVSDYRRELDIQQAISTVSYRIGETRYTRETLVSHPQQVIIFRLTAQGKDKLNFSCHFDSKLLSRSSVKQGMLQMNGWAPAHTEPNYRGNIANAIVNDTTNAMRFVSMLKVLKTDGKQKLQDSTLSVSGATEVVLALSMATSYNGIDKNPGTEGKSEDKLAAGYLSKIANTDYQSLKKIHYADFGKYFNRVSLTLGDAENENLSTVDRLNRFAAGHRDNSLIALFYQYSRYLLISSSREGGLPANLQGIWNESVRPPWSSNYTTNINAEMNYWGAETADLPEMHRPLFDFIGRLVKPGHITAQNFYHAGGWVCHHNSDMWAMTNPVGDSGEGDPCWANWPMGGVWLSTHLWEHYAFTKDEAFLRDQAYPVMKGAVRFCLDFLTADKKGYLVTAPSTSPENVYITDNGYVGQTLYGSTADLAMIKELFVDYLKAAAVLNIDKEIQAQVKQTFAKIYPYQIGKQGNLQEWYHDWADKEPHHRHLSHLFAAYPGYTITTAETPELADAVRKSLQLRTNEGTGWAITWRINLWARMQNAERACDAVKKLMRFVGQDAAIKYGGGGVYANLFGAHPPFQIDGNFGGGAGISEMLLQSHQDYIELLPALPEEWQTGAVKGFVARGNFVLNYSWDKGQLKELKLLSRKGGICEVKYKDQVKTLHTKAGKSYELTF